ncbi:MAG: hypothetical protein DRN53_02275 [Thermoprotei archaeon]|nr:MAG: hypothetical protein DRN53_02275 [Thermoprotei archaeon]
MCLQVPYTSLLYIYELYLLEGKYLLSPTQMIAITKTKSKAEIGDYLLFESIPALTIILMKLKQTLGSTRSLSTGRCI